MIFTDDYLYIHMPKTGGTWFRHLLQRVAGGKMSGEGHDPAFFLDTGEGRASIGDRVIVGTARHPVAWYLSLYRHALRKGSTGRAGGNLLTDLEAWGNGSLEFRDVLRGWTHMAGVGTIPRSVGVIYAWHGHTPADVLLSGVGLCSSAIRYQYGLSGAVKRPTPLDGMRWGVDVLLVTDELYAGASALLRQPITPDNAPRQNVAGHGGCSWDAYDAEMLQWVAEADGDLLDFMGWPADASKPLEQPTMRYVPGIGFERRAA